MKILCSIILVLSSLGVIVSCQSSRNTESTISKANRLIDENRETEAIALLEKEVSRDSNDPQLKVTLASAYAHLAGFKIQKLFPAYEQIKSEEALNSALNQAEAKESTSEAVYLSSQVARFVLEVQSRIRVYSKIPMVDPKKYMYLEKAIQILSSLGESIEKGDVVFRGLLRIIQFRYKADEFFNSKRLFVTDESSGICRLDQEVLSNSVVGLTNILIAFYQDYAHAQPAKKIQALKTANDIMNTSIKLTKAAASFNLADESFKLILKQTLVANGLGSIFGCK